MKIGTALSHSINSKRVWAEKHQRQRNEYEQPVKDLAADLAILTLAAELKRYPPKEWCLALSPVHRRPRNAYVYLQQYKANHVAKG